MTIDLPTGRRGQTLAAALTLTVLAALWAGVAVPLADWYSERADLLDRQQALLVRMQALADSALALQQQDAASAAGAVPASAVLDDSTDAVAGATLQGTVQSMASTAGASLTSAAALPPQPAGGWRRIGVRVTLRAAWPALVQLLQSIEHAAPHMIIDDLQLHADAPGPQVSGEQIDASFAVYAFRAATPEKPPRQARVR